MDYATKNKTEKATSEVLKVKAENTHDIIKVHISDLGAEVLKAEKRLTLPTSNTFFMGSSDKANAIAHEQGLDASKFIQLDTKGAGMEPEDGMEMMENAWEAFEINTRITPGHEETPQFTIYTVGMGGGTGTGAAQFITEKQAELNRAWAVEVSGMDKEDQLNARRQVAAPVWIMTKPHKGEVGYPGRIEITNNVLAEISKDAGFMIIDIQRVVKRLRQKRIPLYDDPSVFGPVVGVEITKATEGISRLVTAKGGNKNLDISDIKRILSKAGEFTVVTGEDENSLADALENAIDQITYNHSLVIDGALGFALLVESQSPALNQNDREAYRSNVDFLNNIADPRAQAKDAHVQNPTINGFRVTLAITGIPFRKLIVETGEATTTKSYNVITREAVSAAVGDVSNLQAETGPILKYAGARIIGRQIGGQFKSCSDRIANGSGNEDDHAFIAAYDEYQAALVEVY